MWGKTVSKALDKSMANKKVYVGSELVEAVLDLVVDELEFGGSDACFSVAAYVVGVDGCLYSFLVVEKLESSTFVLVSVLG